ALLAASLLFELRGTAWGAAPAPSLEYDVKAAFLFNFAKFVEWPPETFPDERAPLALCIIGDDPFGASLESLVAGEKLDHRPLTVRHTSRPGDLKSCQIAFIARSEEARMPEILAALRGTSVLSVGESDHFAEQGGIIQFVLEANRVRFAVNLDALEHTRLKASSKLLRLARVISGPHGGSP
nr:YfiR family protein [Acidobacteriota bacterium]